MGHFISASDVAHPSFQENGDMIYPWNLGECFTSSGLQYISDPDWDLEPFYLQKENLHTYGKINCAGYIMQTEAGCTSCKGLPDYHYFCHGLQRETYLSVCLYTLRKKNSAMFIGTDINDYFIPPSKAEQVVCQIKWKILRVLVKYLRWWQIRSFIRPKLIIFSKRVGVYLLLRKLFRPSNRPSSGG